jgi:molybdenum cofactor cytidylyltransferase
MSKSALGAVVLAAGHSRRMGRFKLLLPWQGGTVIGQVVTTLAQAGVDQILVVTGNRAEDVALALPAGHMRAVLNPRWAEGEMLSSIQTGLAALSSEEDPVAAALLCLGDQPQMQVATVVALAVAGAATEWKRLVVPSYQMRSGHPILLPRWIWPAVLAAQDHLRSVMAAHRADIDYVTVDTPTILADLDTPEDYAREGPAAGMI